MCLYFTFISFQCGLILNLWITQADQYYRYWVRLDLIHSQGLCFYKAGEYNVGKACPQWLFTEQIIWFLVPHSSLNPHDYSKNTLVGHTFKSHSRVSRPRSLQKQRQINVSSNGKGHLFFFSTIIPIFLFSDISYPPLSSKRNRSLILRNPLGFLKLHFYYRKKYRIRKFTEMILCKNLFPIELLYNHNFKQPTYDFQIYVLDQTFLLDLRPTFSNVVETATRLDLGLSFRHWALNMSHTYPRSFFPRQTCCLHYIPYTVGRINSINNWQPSCPSQHFENECDLSLSHLSDEFSLPLTASWMLLQHPSFPCPHYFIPSFP